MQTSSRVAFENPRLPFDEKIFKSLSISNEQYFELIGRVVQTSWRVAFENPRLPFDEKIFKSLPQSLMSSILSTISFEKVIGLP